MSNTGIQIVYDGDCPFCSSYVELVKLREAVGNTTLINARDDHPLVGEIRALGLDLNEGMVAKYDGKIYHGDECVHLLSTLADETGPVNRLIKRLFASKARTKGMYPFMRGARNLTLKILGRSKLS